VVWGVAESEAESVEALAVELVAALAEESAGAQQAAESWWGIPHLW